MNKGAKRAFEIIAHHIAQVENCVDLISVVLVGSLSNDSYSGNEGSDIDLIHVLRVDAPEKARLSKRLRKTSQIISSLTCWITA